MNPRRRPPSAPALALIVFGASNPLSECADRIRGDSTPDATIADAGTTVATVDTAAVRERSGPSTTVATTAAATAKPTARPSPSPSPAPSPSPSPSRRLVYDNIHGVNGGLYPRAAAFITVRDVHAATLRKCYTAAGVTSESWGVTTKVLVPKGGTISLQITPRREGVDATDATARSLEDCHRTTISQWPWPSTADIEGMNGGPGYIIVGSSMSWRAN